MRAHCTAGPALATLRPTHPSVYLRIKALQAHGLCAAVDARRPAQHGGARGIVRCPRPRHSKLGVLSVRGVQALEAPHHRCGPQRGFGSKSGVPRLADRQRSAPADTRRGGAVLGVRGAAAKLVPPRSCHDGGPNTHALPLPLVACPRRCPEGGRCTAAGLGRRLPAQGLGAQRQQPVGGRSGGAAWRALQGAWQCRGDLMTHPQQACKLQL